MFFWSVKIKYSIVDAINDNVQRSFDGFKISYVYTYIELIIKVDCFHVICISFISDW